MKDETIERQRSTRLASRYFRNIWHRSTTDEFAAFRELVESTWPHTTINRPVLPSQYGAKFEMFFEEHRKTREISWSGFGFQVWLQILTHALRGDANSIFVLDEADIYLHPDLQRSMLRVICSRFPQYFLGTHSTEIINDAGVGDIVSINAKHNHGVRIKTDDQYNSVFTYIGSLENVEIAKLSRAKKVVFFESRDKKLLTKFSKATGVTDWLDDSNILVIGVGGFGQWKKVVEAAWTFKSVLKIDVSILAVFDRDYRDQRDLDEICADITEDGVSCLIWDRKEIENYALVENPLCRAIKKRAEVRGYVLTEEAARSIILDISDGYRHDVYGNLLSEHVECERRLKSGLDQSTIASRLSKEFDGKWKDLNTRLKLLPGKQFVADLSTHLQDAYGFSLTIFMIIDEISVYEFDPGFVEKLRVVESFCAPLANA